MAAEFGFSVCRKCLATEGLTSLLEGDEERLEMLESVLNHGGIDVRRKKTQNFRNSN
jgi:hypothetical protein